MARLTGGEATKATILMVSASMFLPGCIQRPIKAANPPVESKPSLPKGLKGQGISVHWMENLLNGKVRPVLDIDAAFGTATTGTRSGTFERCKGYFYQNGKRVLRFEAPRVEAAEGQQRVVATGGVKIWSIDPPGVTMLADRVTWQVQKNRVMAEKRVILKYEPTGSAAISGSLGPLSSLTIDTQLKNYSYP